MSKYMVKEIIEKTKFVEEKLNLFSSDKEWSIYQDLSFYSENETAIYPHVQKEKIIQYLNNRFS